MASHAIPRPNRVTREPFADAPHHALDRARPVWTRLLDAVTEMVERASRLSLAPRVARSLSQLDDRTLKDLGIHRSQIPALEEALRRRWPT